MSKIFYFLIVIVGGHVKIGLDWSFMCAARFAMFFQVFFLSNSEVFPPLFENTFRSWPLQLSFSYWLYLYILCDQVNIFFSLPINYMQFLSSLQDMGLHLILVYFSEDHKTRVVSGFSLLWYLWLSVILDRSLDDLNW